MEAVRLQVSRVKMTFVQQDNLKLWCRKMVNSYGYEFSSASPCLGLHEQEKNDMEKLYVALCNSVPEQSLRHNHNFSNVNDDEVITLSTSVRNRLINMRKNIGPMSRRYGWVGSESRYPFANQLFTLWLEFLDALEEDRVGKLGE